MVEWIDGKKYVISIVVIGPQKKKKSLIIIAIVHVRRTIRS